MNKSLPDNLLKIFIDHLNETFFVHFNLYKYVFTVDREDLAETKHRNVVCPTLTHMNNLTLEDAKPFKIYENEKKIKELEQKEILVIEKFRSQKDVLANNEISLKNLVNFNTNDIYEFEEPLDENV